jgi:branched-chain amino acid transport system ATP-binding protein
LSATFIWGIVIMADTRDGSGGVALGCERVSSGWGATQVITDISFELPAGETLAVLGRNGVGKTTLISTIAGRADIKEGIIRLAGGPIQDLPRFTRAARGLGFVPQEREIFPSLSVEENLTVAARSRGRGMDKWTLARVYDLFPRLRERRNIGGTKLSGGEQQMLCIGRALMGNPTVLLMDEPMEGLAPVVVDLIVDAIKRIRAESDVAILLVEQHVEIALEFTSRFLVMDRGAVIFDAADGTRRVDPRFLESLVGVDALA